MHNIQFHPPLHSYLSLLKIDREKNPSNIWDPGRKKWILVTREELIRQLFINMLSNHWPISRMAAEKRIAVYQRQKRFDLVLFEKSMKPYLLFEFKNPEVRIDNSTFGQAAQYNFTLQVPYLCISNGAETYCCEIDWQTKSYSFLKELPL